MINRYEDFFCLQTGKGCERDLHPLCPKSETNIVEWCIWFTNKEIYSSTKTEK